MYNLQLSGLRGFGLSIVIACFQVGSPDVDAQSPVRLSTDGLSKTEKERFKREIAALAHKLDIYSIEPDGSRYRANVVDKPLLDSFDIMRRQHGSHWAWTVAGRPVVVAELYANDLSDRWNCAMLTVSKSPVIGDIDGRTWRARNGATGFRDIPKTPTPSSRRAIRLAQMRKIARRFTAHSNNDGRRELRLLAQPVYRYQVGEDIDGAIFSFVHGHSNPELILLVESNATQWEYCANRCTIDELYLELDGRQVWSHPRAWGGPGEPVLCTEAVNPAMRPRNRRARFDLRDSSIQAG